MDADQLRELILDVYSARKEAKEYFEFFLDPDVDKLRDKLWTVIEKELNRTKRRQLAARFSHITAQLKYFESMGIDAERVLGFMLRTLTLAVFLECRFYAAPSYVNGIVRLFGQTVKYADAHLLFAQNVENFNTLLGAIIKAKPAAAKGQYIRSCVVAATMGPGIKVNPLKLDA